MAPGLAALLVCSLACRSSKDLDDTAGSTGDGGTGDAGTGDGGVGDGGEPGDGGGDGGGADGGSSDGGGTPDPVLVHDLVATIHDTMESIIVLTWSQEGEGEFRAELAADGGAWIATPTWTLGPGEHRMLLLGAPFEARVTWRLLVDGAPVQADAEIETGPIPSGMPRVSTATGDATAWDPDAAWVLLSLAPRSSARAWTIIIDRAGRPIWGVETPARRTTFAPQLSVDGREVLVDHNSWWGAYDGGVNSQVARYDIEGNLLGTWATPGLIHPFTQKGDGAIVWGASLGSGSSGETLNILEPTASSPRVLLDCNALARAHGESYCGSNHLWWDPATDHILFSLYSIETIIEVDTDGEAVRWFGHMRDGWTFEDEDDAFWWQHGGHFLETGNLLVSSKVSSSGTETVLREYELDEANQSLRMVREFGRGEGLYAYILGEGRMTPGGHYMRNLGYDPMLVELSPDGTVVWQVDYPDSAGTMGRSFVVEDLYALWQDTP